MDIAATNADENAILGGGDVTVMENSSTSGAVAGENCGMRPGRAAFSAPVGEVGGDDNEDDHEADAQHNTDDIDGRHNGSPLRTSRFVTSSSVPSAVLPTGIFTAKMDSSDSPRSADNDDDQSSTPVLTYFLHAKGRNELARLIFIASDIPYEENLISLDDYRTQRSSLINMPFGQVPTLKFRGKVIAQSCTIVRLAARLAGIYPPAGIMKQCVTDMIVDAWRDILDALYGLVFDRELVNGTYEMVPHFHDAKRIRSLEQFEKHVLEHHLNAFEFIYTQHEAKSPHGYLLGDTPDMPGLADLAVYDAVQQCRRFMSPEASDGLLAKYPHILHVCELIEAIPTIRAHLGKWPNDNVHEQLFGEQYQHDNGDSHSSRMPSHDEQDMPHSYAYDMSDPCE
eukprot:gene1328-1921_t